LIFSPVRGTASIPEALTRRSGFELILGTTSGEVRMSHFTVLVIGDDPEEQLAPFQENNMGDCPKEYLKFVDVEEEERSYYGNETDSTGVPYKTKYPDFHSYMEANGYEKDPETGKYGYWENPNRKWDWYSLGGRWTGFFKVKPSYTGRLVVGRPGIMTPEARVGYVDQALKKDIDFDTMRDEAGQRAAERYDEVAALYGGTIPRLEFRWETVLEDPKYSSMDIDEKRSFYHSQSPLVLKTNLAKNRDSLTKIQQDFVVWGSLEDYQVTKEEFVQDARDGAITTFAVLKDGTWYEEGSMGWWGIVGDRKERNKWISEFSKLLDSLPDDTLLSVYDCHI